MAEVLVPALAETVALVGVRAKLTAAGDTARVVSTVPSTRPGRMVRIRQRGGSRRSLVVDEPRFVVECWDVAGWAQAERLAALVAGAWVALDGETVAGQYVLSAQILGLPSNDPDPDTATPRYTLTTLLRLRAAERTA